MCFDEKTSWITFTLGTIINILIVIFLYTEYKKTKNNQAIIAILLLIPWQFALFMQLPDALAWKHLQNNDSVPINIGKSAYILNILQPVISFIAIFLIYLFLGKSINILIPIFILLIIYSISTLTFLTKNPNFNIAPEKSCFSLNYYWWDNKISAILYFITMIAILLAIPNNKWRIVNICIFVLSFVMMNIFSKKCNSSSLWCWSIAPAGLIIFFTYLLTKN